MSKHGIYDLKYRFIPNDDCPQEISKPITNADYIRAMSDEELAEFIGCDPMYNICPNDCQNDSDRPCKVCALDWLKQEME